MSDTLDGLLTGSAGSPTTPENHLHYPVPSSDDTTVSTAQAEQQPRTLLKDRLFIGNLHPSIDEFSLLQVFSKFGKVTKLDFLFHKTGLLKGKPRGYAFVEYGNKDDALKALTMAHDKLLRGRKIVVTYAHQAPLDHLGSVASPNQLARHRKSVMETGRPTTLSMLKTGMGSRNDGTQDKIAMMEAKLRQMESTGPKPSTLSETPESFSEQQESIAATSTIPLHPSLPVKPPPTISASMDLDTTSSSTTRTTIRQIPKQPKTPLPSLPILPVPRQAQTEPKRTPATLVAAAPQTSRMAHSGKPKLVGVKIKPKEKDKEKDKDKKP